MNGKGSALYGDMMDGATNDLDADMLKLAKRMAVEAKPRVGICEAVSDGNGWVHVYNDGVLVMSMPEADFIELRKIGPVLP